MPTFTVKNNAQFSDPIQLSSEDEHHLLRVMRVAKGECFSVTNNLGQIAKLKVTSLKPFDFSLEEIREAEKPTSVSVCLSLIDLKKIELVVQKLTELNIESLQLLITERSQLRELSSAKLQRLQIISAEAQKQCGRATPLVMKEPCELNRFDFSSTDQKFVGAISTEVGDLNKIPLAPFFKGGTRIIPTLEKGARGISEMISPTEKRICFIGPEGGFTDLEMAFFQKQGCQFLNLGESILRSETAAIVMASLMKYLSYKSL